MFGTTNPFFLTQTGLFPVPVLLCLSTKDSLTVEFLGDTWMLSAAIEKLALFLLVWMKPPMDPYDKSQSLMEIDLFCLDL